MKDVLNAPCCAGPSFKSFSCSSPGQVQSCRFRRWRAPGNLKVPGIAVATGLETGLQENASTMGCSSTRSEGTMVRPPSLTAAGSSMAGKDISEDTLEIAGASLRPGRAGQHLQGADVEAGCSSPNTSSLAEGTAGCAYPFGMVVAPGSSRAGENTSDDKLKRLAGRWTIAREGCSSPALVEGNSLRGSPAVAPDWEIA